MGADHGMTEQEFKDKYSALTSEFQDIQKDAIKTELKQQLKEELTQMLADYDRDGDGKLSAADQRQFLEDIQKSYALDLSEEIARAEAHPEEWQQAYDESQQAFAAAEAQQEETEEEMLADPQEFDSAYDFQPSNALTFFVSAIAGAALTTVGIQIYRKKSRRVGLKENC